MEFPFSKVLGVVGRNFEGVCGGREEVGISDVGSGVGWNFACKATATMGIDLGGGMGYIK